MTTRAITTAVILSALLAASCAFPAPLSAQPKTLTGVIRSYECGDNCYLRVVDGGMKVHTGLCSARECRAWNEEAAMPARFKGRRVAVTLGEGTQRDASGNVMGKMTAFTSIRFLD